MGFTRPNARCCHLLPFVNLFQRRIGHAADQVRQDPQTVKGLKMRLDVAQ